MVNCGRFFLLPKSDVQTSVEQLWLSGMSAIMALFYLKMYTGAVPKKYGSKTSTNQKALKRFG